MEKRHKESLVDPYWTPAHLAVICVNRFSIAVDQRTKTVDVASALCTRSISTPTPNPFAPPSINGSKSRLGVHFLCVKQNSNSRDRGLFQEKICLHPYAQTSLTISGVRFRPTAIRAASRWTSSTF